MPEGSTGSGCLLPWGWRHLAGRPRPRTVLRDSSTSPSRDPAAMSACGPLTGCDFVGIVVVVRDVAFLATVEHVDRIVDVGSVSLLAQIDLLGLDRRGVL